MGEDVGSSRKVQAAHCQRCQRVMVSEHGWGPNASAGLNCNMKNILCLGGLHCDYMETVQPILSHLFTSHFCEHIANFLSKMILVQRPPRHQEMDVCSHSPCTIVRILCDNATSPIYLILEDIKRTEVNINPLNSDLFTTC